MAGRVAKFLYYLYERISLSCHFIITLDFYIYNLIDWGFIHQFTLV